MKKVKALQRFKDLEADKIREKDEEFEVEDKRAKYLADRQMVKVISSVTAKKKTAKTKAADE